MAEAVVADVTWKMLPLSAEEESMRHRMPWKDSGSLVDGLGGGEERTTTTSCLQRATPSMGACGACQLQPDSQASSNGREEREQQPGKQHKNGEDPREGSNSGGVGCSTLYVVTPVKFMNSRARPGQAYEPTKFEHIANMVTHGLIIAPAILGLVWMLSLTTTQQQFWAAFVYGGSTLALFITSTMFHTLCYHSGNFRGLKEFFHIGDRAIIYIFIAASYTPWLTLKDSHGWGPLALWVVWIGAAAGICYQYTFHEQYKWLETLFYLIVGVCPSIIIAAMKECSGLYEMALGGAVYIIGVIFFKCDGRIPFAHAIWHCFVFVGAVFHYCAVCKHLLGGSTYHADLVR